MISEQHGSLKLRQRSKNDQQISSYRHLQSPPTLTSTVNSFNKTFICTVDHFLFKLQGSDWKFKEIMKQNIKDPQ